MPMWVENGLIEKLVANEVAEKQGNDIVFTKPFSVFMIDSVNHQTSLKTIDECRNVMRRYNSALRYLSDHEVRAAMVLLGFYIEHMDKRIPAGR
jgi:hypothetical protein